MFGEEFLRSIVDFKVRITWVETRKWNPIVLKEDAHVVSLSAFLIVEVGNNHDPFCHVRIYSHMTLRADLC